MIESIIYFASLILFFALCFRIMRALHIEEKFEKFKIWEIKAAYILFSLICAHILAEIVIRLYSLFDFSSSSVIFGV